ncbi:hypothetical protein Salat_2095900 [Sesamum alatum]|uniref:Uncharacterized protein n=1 Tax=Sesamum alatum TaxID=300844 RepID=A0AAE1Y1Q2_9LAMI|nr:hypothetical protein Salat_2095900 [Sesamum alatum]
MAARTAIMANEGCQRQAKLIEMARAVEIQVGLEPLDVPLTSHAGTDPRSQHAKAAADDQAPDAAGSHSPLANAIPIKEHSATHQGAAFQGEGGGPINQGPGDGAAPYARADSPTQTGRFRKGKQHVSKPAPSDVPCPKRHQEGNCDKGKRVVEGEDEEGPLPPMFMGIDAFSHLTPNTINISTNRLGVCYKNVWLEPGPRSARLSISDTQLPPDEVSFILDWQVSSNSSVFNSKVREVSFEMYKVGIHPQDQIALASLHHAHLEILGANLHHQLAEVLHAMSLQCSYWHYDFNDIQSWIKSIEASNQSHQSDLTKTSQDLTEMEAKFATVEK